MFAKIDVNGDDAHPLYRYLKAEKPGLLGTGASSGTSRNSSSARMARSSNATRRQRSRMELRKAIEALL